MNANLRRKFWKAGLIGKVDSKEETTIMPEIKNKVETKVEEQAEQSSNIEELLNIIEEQEVVQSEEVKPKNRKLKKLVDDSE